MTIIRRILLLVFLALRASAEDGRVLGAWVGAQTNIQSWSADFVQTRKLKTMVQPLTATGRVWFAAPNRFRWELGQPPQTIAVRAPSELLIFYPRLKRVERLPLAGVSGPWRDALLLLEAGFPRNLAELQARYNVLSQKQTGMRGEVVLQPKSEAARRMIPSFKSEFDVQNFSLLATELEFANGSTMRNDFKNSVLNPQIDEKLFTPEIPADYKIIEPLKKQK